MTPAPGTTHRERGHAAYGANPHAALKGHLEPRGKPAGELVADLAVPPDGIGTAIRGNGGDDANRNLFGQLIAPARTHAPGGEHLGAIGPLGPGWSRLTAP